MTEIEPYRLVDEDVEFRLPVELRRELALAETQQLNGYAFAGGGVEPESVGQRSAL